MNDENGNALAAHYAMQGRSVGRARLSTVGRENLGSGRYSCTSNTGRSNSNNNESFRKVSPLAHCNGSCPA